jgi:signal transduction histidine kinase/DNA-binding NarL/FixJ family response regulator
MRTASITKYWKRSIETKIGITIILIIVGILSLFGISQYREEEVANTKELNEFADATITRLADQLILPLWELDTKWINKVITSEMMDKNIYAIYISGEGNISVGKKRNTQWYPVDTNGDISGDYIVKSGDIIKNNKSIGTAKLYVSNKFMVAKLRRVAGKLMLTIAILGISIFFLLSFILHKVVVYPIEQILTVANAIADGNLDWNINVRQQDEIGSLARGFAAMRDRIRQRGAERDKAEEALRQSEEELRKHRDHLGELVAERTAELAIAKEKSEAANRAKSVFLANMNHELRTPLNAVLGFSHLMINAPDVTAEQRENLNIISRSGEHLLNLINNVLEISKIESGRIALEKSHFDLHLLIHEVKLLMAVRASGKGLSFAVEQQPDIPRHVSTDPGKLRQILINLLGNAIKFTKSGGVALRAMVVEQEANQRLWIRFQVEDTGSGIREEDRERIFSPFVQLGEQPPTEAGTGLGLTICKQYVELMEGRIGVANNLDRGSVFHIEVPVEVLAAGPIPVEPWRGRVTGLAEGQPLYRILIAEDQLEGRLLLCKLLEPLGFDIREALDGREAVMLFERWHPHLIFMDIRMPVTNGLEATRHIKSSEAGIDTRIVALTAHTMEDERREILSAGCDDFIRKPYRDTEIFDALAKHLGVRFEYAGEHGAVAEERQTDPEQLRKLPPDLIRDLLEATELLDGRRCLEVVSRISGIDDNLGEHLRRIVENQEYQELLSALDRVNVGEKI